jgi:hypothetical protein
MTHAVFELIPFISISPKIWVVTRFEAGKMII